MIDAKSYSANRDTCNKLRQALDILTMNSHELISYIEDQLKKYLVSEFFISNEANSINIRGQRNKYNPAGLRKEIEDFNEESEAQLPKYFHNGKFLRDYLYFQLHTSMLNKKEMLIGEYIIDNIDENGYLTTNLEKISVLFQIPVDRVEKVLFVIHTFDPPGICARNLEECLLIQLNQNGIHDSDVQKAIKYHLDDFAWLDAEEISKKMGISQSRVEEILKIIKGLEPKPGRAFFNNNEINYIIPDILIEKSDKKFKVRLNRDSLPSVDINYLRNKMNDSVQMLRISAKDYEDSILWLAKCIENRVKILMKITHYIVKNSQDFFLYGKNHFTRISIDKAEKDLKIKRSIIKRVVKNKYLKCSFGIYEISKFFY
ncbi:MAG TPA: hypothetical protein GXX49_06465 [Clostridiaceae bacterium]|nr:hypothetical protein [Clostridiaceae bacterium]